MNYIRIIIRLGDWFRIRINVREGQTSLDLHGLLLRGTMPTFCVEDGSSSIVIRLLQVDHMVCFEKLYEF